MAMSYEERLKVTTEILTRHVDIDRAIAPTDHIQNDLGLDSLGVMEVVADIEDRFEVQIPQDVLSTISTVEDVVKALVAEAITATGASGPKDIGKVMGAVTPKTKGRFDGARVSELVKSALAS